MRRYWLAGWLLFLVYASACDRELRGQSPTVRPQQPPGVPTFAITGPTVIIAAPITRNRGGRRSNEQVDSLRRTLETRTVDLRAALAKRRVATFVAVADSLSITRDSGSHVVRVAGDSMDYVLVAPHRAPRVMLEEWRHEEWRHMDLLEEVEWYLLTNEDPLDHAVKAVRHRRSSESPQLPTAFARELDSLGCTIPESMGDPMRDNVITGSFARRGQTDWAVLCARQGKVGILVFWGGPSACPRDLENGEERSSVQDIGGQTVFLYALSKADSSGMANIPGYGLEPDLLAARKEALSDQGHDGMEYSYEEKGSTVWYCTGGHWISLGGGD